MSWKPVDVCVTSPTYGAEFQSWSQDDDFGECAGHTLTEAMVGILHHLAAAGAVGAPAGARPLLLNGPGGLESVVLGGDVQILQTAGSSVGEEIGAGECEESWGLCRAIRVCRHGIGGFHAGPFWRPVNQRSPAGTMMWKGYITPGPRSVPVRRWQFSGSSQLKSVFGGGAPVHREWARSFSDGNSHAAH